LCQKASCKNEKNDKKDTCCPFKNLNHTFFQGPITIYSDGPTKKVGSKKNVSEKEIKGRKMTKLHVFLTMTFSLFK
jgi:hypothetical protein